MLTGFVPEAERLEDPLVVEWVVARMEEAQAVGATERVEALAAAFDDEVLRRHLEAGGYLTRGLISALPPERLAPFPDLLVASWHAAPLSERWIEGHALAQAAPDRLRELLAAEVARLDELDDTADVDSRAAGLAELAGELGEAGAPIARDVVAWVAAQAGGAGRSEELGRLVEALVRVGEEEAAAELLAEAATDDDLCCWQDPDDVFWDVWAALVPLSPWYGWVWARLRGRTTAELDDLVPLLAADAPLARLREAVEGGGGEHRLNEVVELLPEPDGTRLLRFAHRLVEELPSVLSLAMMDELGQLLLATVLHCAGRPGPDLTGMGLQEVVRLAAADVPDLPGREVFLERLGREEPAAVVAATRAALEDAEDGWEGLHLTHLLAEIGAPEYLELLLDAVVGDWTGPGVEVDLEVPLVRFGVAAAEALVARWESEYAEDDRPFDVLRVVGGDHSVELVLAGIARDRADCDALARWAELAEALGDPAPTEVLLPELRRRIWKVDHAVVTLPALHGVDLPAADEAARRLRTCTYDLSADDLVCCECGASHPAPDLPKLGGVVLRCTACGDANRYGLDRVYAAPKGTDGPPYLGDELDCLSCRAADTQAPTYRACSQLRLAAKDGEVVEGRAPLPGGRTVPVAEAVAWYEARLAEEPDSIPDLAGLGQVLARFGPRRGAVAILERCLALDPVCVDAALDLAGVLRAQGESERAFGLLGPFLSADTGWHSLGLHGSGPAATARSLLASYNGLAAELGRPRLEASSLPAAAQRRRVGRNDPCPCGSGKKYKKCCLRRRR